LRPHPGHAERARAADLSPVAKRRILFGDKRFNAVGKGVRCQTSRITE
jgi:hypothetical protein